MEERFHSFNRRNKGVSDFYKFDGSSTSESESEYEDDDKSMKEWIKISKAMICSDDSECKPNEQKIKIEPNSSTTRTNLTRIQIKIKCCICLKTMLRSSFPKHVRKVHVGANIGHALASSMILKATDIDSKETCIKIESEYEDDKMRMKMKTSSKTRKNRSRFQIKCSICFKTMLKSNLRRHMRNVHTGTNIGNTNFDHFKATKFVPVQCKSANAITNHR